MPKGDKLGSEVSNLLPGDSTSKNTSICLLETDAIFQEKIRSGNKAFAKLKIVVCICFLFMIVEIAGGLWSDSLAILSDAAHMLSDVAGFGISMVSIKVAQKKPTSSMTFGYQRAEVLGALASVMSIQFMVFYLSW
jgi:Co/Zn/Cd efflux system component